MRSGIVPAWAVPGWFSDEEACAIAAAARSLRAEGTLVEIGTWMGRSAAHLADLLPSWRIVTVDSYTEEAVEIAAHCVTSAPPLGPQPSPGDVLDPRAAAARFLAGRKNVDRYLLPAHNLAEHWGDRVDLLFIDGEHSANAVDRDLRAWLVHAPEIIVFHDATTTNFGPEILKGAAPHLMGWSRLEQFEAGSLRTFRLSTP